MRLSTLLLVGGILALVFGLGFLLARLPYSPSMHYSPSQTQSSCHAFLERRWCSLERPSTWFGMCGSPLADEGSFWPVW